MQINEIQPIYICSTVAGKKVEFKVYFKDRTVQLGKEE